MTEINNTLLMALIKGLKYNDKTEEYTFKHKKCKSQIFSYKLTLPLILTFNIYLFVVL